MPWTAGGQSQDIEDQRNETGGGGFRPRGIHLGLGGIVILLLPSWVFKRNFFTLIESVPDGAGGSTVTQTDPAQKAREEPPTLPRHSHARECVPKYLGVRK